jgi:hypothetical protein
MSQLSYSQNGPVAFAGMLGDLRTHTITTKAAQTAPIDFGKAVVLGTNKEKQVVAAGSGVGQGALIAGIAAASHTIEQTAAGLVQYPVGSAVNVLEAGSVWVETFDAVVAGEVANYHLASGKFTDTAVGAGVEAVARLSVRFITGTAAAGLAMVSVGSK